MFTQILQSDYLPRDLSDIVVISITVAVVLLLACLTWYQQSKIKRLTNKLIDFQSEIEIVRNEADKNSHNKSNFIAAAAHDLRQPLQALTLFCDALNEQTLDPSSKELSGKINQSLHALVELFNTLFDISNIETGLNQVNNCDFSLQALLQQLSESYQPQMTAKGLSWQCEASEIAVHSDKVLLETIIRNLISNALRYTSTGGVAVITAEQNDRVQITVRDTGIGIPENLQKDIFQEYHQLRQDSHATITGFGLGLSIVDRLIHLLGHDIKVKSSLGKGTDFVLNLPAAKTKCPEKPFEEPIPIKDTIGLQALVIDNDTAVLDSLHTLLSSWQCTVHSAENAEQVFELFSSNPVPIDVIISDYRLSTYSTGIKIIQVLKTEYKIDVPVLIITAENSETSLQDIHRSKHMMLPKPVLPAQLRSFLRSVARQKRTTPKSITKSDIALPQFIQTIINEIDKKAAQKGISILCKCAELNVVSNKEMLETIIRRLIKFALKQTIANEVIINCHSLPSGIKLTVNDNADMISKRAEFAIKQLAVGAQPSAHNTVTCVDTDMGMSIVCELARQLNHQIEVDFDQELGNQYSILFLSH